MLVGCTVVVSPQPSWSLFEKLSRVRSCQVVQYTQYPPFSKGPDSWSWEVSRLSPYGSWHRFLFFLRSLIYPLEFRYLLNFFFSLPRRLKIELTRKKNKTWIVMGLPSLNRSKDWKELFLVPTALQKSTSKISNFFSKILEPLLASSESSESS